MALSIVAVGSKTVAGVPFPLSALLIVEDSVVGTGSIELPVLVTNRRLAGCVECTSIGVILHCVVGSGCIPLPAGTVYRDRSIVDDRFHLSCGFVVIDAAAGCGVGAIAAVESGLLSAV